MQYGYYHDSAILELYRKVERSHLVHRDGGKLIGENITNLIDIQPTSLLTLL